MNDYLNTAKYYDYLYTYSDMDIWFYKQQLRRNMRILDVGCGTGRVALNIHTKYNNITIDCIDHSEKMLEIFERKLSDKKYKKIKNRINIFKMDMNNIILEHKYDMIIFPFQTFQVLIEQQEQINCLTRCSSLLKDNGKIIISFFIDNMGIEEKEVFKGLYNMDGNFLLYIQKDNKIIQRKHSWENLIKIYNKDGILIEENNDFCELYKFDLNEIIEVINLSNLQIENIYSSYYKQPFDNKSPDCIFEISKNNNSSNSLIKWFSKKFSYKKKNIIWANSIEM
jgi:ubiquinone/menaquinone biosynthesis C-methylase UbiE